jgi:hypothetical protein
MENNYFEKYLEYKKKYLELQKIYGGGSSKGKTQLIPTRQSDDFDLTNETHLKTLYENYVENKTLENFINKVNNDSNSAKLKKNINKVIYKINTILDKKEEKEINSNIYKTNEDILNYIHKEQSDNFNTFKKELHNLFG